LRFEREIHRGGPFHRPFPVHPATHQFAGFAFNDRGASCSHVLVAIPAAHGADAGSRAGIGVLHIRIELQERVPNGKVVMVVHLLEQRGRRGRQGGAAFHAEVGRPQGDDNQKQGDYNGETDEDFRNHKGGVDVLFVFVISLSQRMRRLQKDSEDKIFRRCKGPVTGFRTMLRANPRRA
jgi:hypothetical protein